MGCKYIDIGKFEFVAKTPRNFNVLKIKTFQGGTIKRCFWVKFFVWETEIVPYFVLVMKFSIVFASFHKVHFREKMRSVAKKTCEILINIFAFFRESFVRCKPKF